MMRLHHPEAPFILWGLSMIAVLLTGLYIWWDERRKKK
jgi:uncharacterized iron-regulated membrane protein